MSRTESTQLNIRSRFARERASALAKQTGLSTTRIVEEALRAYQPHVVEEPHGLVRKGGILVRPSHGRKITLDQANAALDATRNERG